MYVVLWAHFHSISLSHPSLVQYLRFKHSASSAVPPPPPPTGTLPQVPTTHVNLTGLQDLMRIRSVSLQQRVPSTFAAK